MMLPDLFPSFRTRNTAPELMDLRSCDPDKLATTIRQFAFINRLFSASSALLRRTFFAAMEKNPEADYSLLDIGAGGCDIDVWMLREARKRGLKLTITAIDHDERVVAAARETVAAYPELTLRQTDITFMPSLGPFDFIFCNHLLHHLDDDEIADLLQSVERQTRIAFLLNDLKRSPWAYFGYSIFAACCLAPSLAQSDGRLSIRKGFVEPELRKFADNALPGIPVRIIRAAPARLALYRDKKTGV